MSKESACKAIDVCIYLGVLGVSVSKPYMCFIVLKIDVSTCLHRIVSVSHVHVRAS